MTIFRKRILTLGIAALTALALSGCGGGNRHVSRTSTPAIATGDGPRFADYDPHPWSYRPPVTYPVHGIDVSRWQGDINWFAARNAGVSFAFLKATEGGDVADPMFRQNWRQTAQAGIARGAYHFYYFCRTPEEQANWFIRHVPKTRGALPPVLDIEWTHSRTCPGRPAPSVVRGYMTRFLNRLEAHYGQRPIVYTTPDFYEDNDLGRLRAEFWLRSVAAHPHVRYPNERWSFWQYTGTGKVPGVSGKTDINVFAGSANSYQNWLQSRTIR